MHHNDPGMINDTLQTIYGEVEKTDSLHSRRLACSTLGATALGSPRRSRNFDNFRSWLVLMQEVSKFGMWNESE
jgi:hypothetical protein